LDRFGCLSSLKPPERKTLQPIDQTATIEQSPGKQVRTALEVIVDHIRNKSPLHDEVIKPFLVDQSNLDKAERIAEAK
jgi:inositol transport system substrate-binding protein